MYTTLPMFSKACEYGIKASIFIAGASSTGRMVSLTDISENIDSPAQFTAKILQNLVRKKIVVSQKGPNGGFSIPPAKAKQLSLLHIVEAIDGDQLFTGCALGFEKCNHQQPCPLHHQFTAVRDDLRHMLEATTLEYLAMHVEEGLSFLKPV